MPPLAMPGLPVGLTFTWPSGSAIRDWNPLRTTMQPVARAASRAASMRWALMSFAVVSTTQIHAGDAWNVIPQECTLRGTVRTFKKSVQDMIEKHIEKIARNVAAGFGAEVIKWRYERRYPATVNSEQETEFAAKAAGALVGLENVKDADLRRGKRRRLGPHQRRGAPGSGKSQMAADRGGQRSIG